MCCISLLFAALIFTHAKIKKKMYKFSFVFLQRKCWEKYELEKLLSLYYFMGMCLQMGVSLKTWLLFKKLNYILVVSEDISQHLLQGKKTFFKRYINNPNVLL